LAFNEDGNEGALNGTTPVVAVSAAVSKRIVKFLSIHNADTVAHTVTIKVNSRIIWKGTLNPGDTWEFGDTNEIIVLTGAKTITMQLNAAHTTTAPEFTAAWAEHT